MDVARLHALVPAAEEEDLLEEVAAERLRRWSEREALAWSRWPASGPLVDLFSPDAVLEDDALLEDEAVPEPADAPAPPSYGEAQVLGMLQHHLGVVVLSQTRPGVDRG